MVVVGTSLGGLSALSVLLSGLNKSFALPLVIVQHRVKTPDDTLVRLLGVQSTLPVKEPQDKDPVEPGVVFLAPSDYHLMLERDRFALSVEAPHNYARPSIDVLFESAAESHGAGVLGIVLTGSNDDGARGALAIKQRGGRVLVQDPIGAESAIMPAAAIAAAPVDAVLSLAGLVAALRALKSGA